MPGSMQIHMKACGVTTPIAIEGSDTIDKIKEQIGNLCEVPPSKIQLSHKDQRLSEGTADQAGLSDNLHVTFLGIGSKTSGYQRIRRVMRAGAALRSYKKVSDTNHAETREAIKKHIDVTAESIVRQVVAAQGQAAASSTDSVVLPTSGAELESVDSAALPTSGAVLESVGSVHDVDSGPASGEKSDGVGDDDSSSGDDDSSESSSDDPNSDKAEGITIDKAEGITADKADGITIDKAEGITADKAEGITADKAEGITADKASDVDMSIVEGIAGMNIDAALNMSLKISILAPPESENSNVTNDNDAIFERFGELQVQTFKALESK